MPFFNTVRNFVNSSTEIKVKELTDDSETSMSNGNGGTLMNEISVLTYSPKTLKEITSVLRKRLQVALYLTRKFSHKNCVIVVKTLTLISYLLNNGSNEFIQWLKTTSNHIFDHLTSVEVDPSQINKTDIGIWTQIQHLSGNILSLLNDSDLLERRRQNVIEFRSSISSPGRKSTDNSHLNVMNPNRYSNDRNSRDRDRDSPLGRTGSLNVNGSRSLDVNRRQEPTMYTIADEEEECDDDDEDNDRFINFRLNRHRDVTLKNSGSLGPLREETGLEDVSQPVATRSTGLTSRMFHASNPFSD